MAHDKQIFRATENFKLSYGGPSQQQASGTKNRENDQEIPQSQTADMPWHREEEPLNHHETPGRQTKQSN